MKKIKTGYNKEKKEKKVEGKHQEKNKKVKLRRF